MLDKPVHPLKKPRKSSYTKALTLLELSGNNFFCNFKSFFLLNGPAFPPPPPPLLEVEQQVGKLFFGFPKQSIPNTFF